MINLNSDIKIYQRCWRKRAELFNKLGISYTFVRLFNFIPENIRIGPMKRWLGIVKTVKKCLYQGHPDDTG